MYEAFKSKKAIKKAVGNSEDVFLEKVRKTLYETGVQLYLTIEKHEATAYDIKKFNSLEGAIAIFLNIREERISKLYICIPMPSALLYKLCVKNFFESNFTTRNNEIEKIIDEKRKKIINRSSLEYIPSDIPIMLSENDTFRFKQICGKLYKVNNSYLAFCEDTDGFKFVFEMRTDYIFMSSNKKPEGITINIHYVSNDQTDDKVQNIMAKLKSYIRDKKIISEGAYDAYGERIEVAKTDWNELKINKQLRDDINFHIIDYINNIQNIKKLGLKTSRGIIICGYPGTGKTLFMRILISHLKIPCFVVRSRDILPSGSQLNPEMLDNVYELAQYISPVVVMFEDGDMFLGKRGTNFNSNILSQFLNKIDGLDQHDGIITIVTANDPSLLDEAVANRPKRFDYILQFPLPAFDERFEILYDKLREYLDDSLKEHLYSRIKDLQGFTGAHLVELADRMKYYLTYNKNIKKLTGEIIDKVIENFKFKKTKNSENNSIGFA